MIEAFLWVPATQALKPGHAPPGKWKALMAALVSWGPGGLFVLAALDSAGVPVVGGVDLLLVNVAAARPSLAYVAALCAIAGSMLGSAVLFAIARKGGELMLAKYIAGRRGARMHRWFERYGLITVFIPALSPLPLPMKIPVFCAGALEVHWTRFLLVVLSARTIRYFSLAYFGVRYGASTLLYLRDHLLAIAFLALGIAAVAVIVLQLRDRRNRARHRASRLPV